METATLDLEERMITGFRESQQELGVVRADASGRFQDVNSERSRLGSDLQRELELGLRAVKDEIAAKEKALKEEHETGLPTWFREWTLKGGMEWLNGPVSSVEELATLWEAIKPLAPITVCDELKQLGEEIRAPLQRRKEEVEALGGVVGRLQHSVIPMVSTLKELGEKQHRGLKEEIEALRERLSGELSSLQQEELERHDALKVMVSQQESFFPQSLSRVKHDVLQEVRESQRQAMTHLSGKLRERDQAFEGQMMELHEKAVVEVKGSMQALVDDCVAQLRAEEHRNKQRCHSTRYFNADSRHSDAG
jgi:hypothetical protein